MRARLAYAKAVELDPTDPESQFWHGWLQMEAGQLAIAHEAFSRVLTLNNQEPSDRRVFWAQIGIADVLVARGNLTEALESYRTSLAIADRLAEADPNNAGWQRDLSVSLNKIGDVLVAQGNLAEALESYRASLAIADRLAEADPNNAGWQRDLALSYGRIAAIQAQQEELDQVLAAFRSGRDIIAALREASADNATLPQDLAWFEAQIAALQS